MEDQATAKDFPKYAIFRGKKYRVMYYVGAGRFRLVGSDDSTRTLHRDFFRFVIGS